MKKIEYVWNHLLYEALEKRNFSFGQQELAQELHLSSSTIHLAIQPLRRMGAVRIGKRHSEVIDAEKILYHWANRHRLQPTLQMSVNLPVTEIEGLLPDQTLPTAYTALRERFGEPPTDYDKVYCYHRDPSVVGQRFEGHRTNGPLNLFVLLADERLYTYRSQVTLGHMFVDLWNLPDWYAKDAVTFVKGKIDAILS